ncbi:uncharacterized protein LOC129962345 [Argiope bruennichi]|uniref:uncharacterized protein LOC129962345 n=1 Tax=Argiope bruennichi TaxID=94029 RepID=UPI0024953858|nr:uncharacterized protein LOC129962345 [Argiope bruennichi]
MFFDNVVLSSFAVLALFSAELFHPVLAVEFYNLQDDYGHLVSKNLDENFEIAWNCTWLIICDFGGVMEMKKIVDAVHKKTVIFFVDELKKLFPEEEFNEKDAFDNEFWKNELEEFACSRPEEEKEKLETIPVLDYGSEICRNKTPDDKAECQKLEEATEIYMDVMMKYRNRCMGAIGKEALEK